MMSSKKRKKGKQTREQKEPIDSGVDLQPFSDRAGDRRSLKVTIILNLVTLVAILAYAVYVD